MMHKMSLVSRKFCEQRLRSEGGVYGDQKPSVAKYFIWLLQALTFGRYQTPVRLGLMRLL